MELQQLRYVLAVARTGNFSRAAELCHVSQPSLSQQIQKLEQELGERLFTRMKRQTVPTAAGRAMLAHAERILSGVEEVQRAVSDSCGTMRGVVQLGILPTIAPFLLPRVMTRFQKSFPEVQVIVQERTTTNLLALAAACEVDFAVLSLPINDERFTMELLLTEDLVLATPPDHRLAKQKEVRIQDVESERFILLQEGHCLGDLALHFCDRHKCHPPVIFRTAQLETIQALVGAGVGVSLVPRMACHAGREYQPAYVSITAPTPQRTIAAIWRKEHHLSRAAALLRNALRETAMEMDALVKAPAKSIARRTGPKRRGARG